MKVDLVKVSKPKFLGVRDGLAKSREVFQRFKGLRDRSHLCWLALLFSSKFFDMYIPSNDRFFNFLFKINIFFT